MNGKGWNRRPLIALGVVLALAALVMLLPIWRPQPLPAKSSPLETFSLNEASYEQLVELPAIGPDSAKKILKARAVQGRFQHQNEIDDIPGLSADQRRTLRERTHL